MTIKQRIGQKNSKMFSDDDIGFKDIDIIFNLASTKNAPFSKESPTGRGPLWLKDCRPSLVLGHLLGEVPPVVCEGLVAPISSGLPFARVP